MVVHWVGGDTRSKLPVATKYLRVIQEKATWFSYMRWDDEQRQQAEEASICRGEFTRSTAGAEEAMGLLADIELDPCHGSKSLWKVVKSHRRRNKQYV